MYRERVLLCICSSLPPLLTICVVHHFATLSLAEKLGTIHQLAASVSADEANADEQEQAELEGQGDVGERHRQKDRQTDPEAGVFEGQRQRKQPGAKHGLSRQNGQNQSINKPP